MEGRRAAAHMRARRDHAAVGNMGTRTAVRVAHAAAAVGGAHAAAEPVGREQGDGEGRSEHVERAVVAAQLDTELQEHRDHARERPRGERRREVDGRERDLGNPHGVVEPDP